MTTETPVAMRPHPTPPSDVFSPYWWKRRLPSGLGWCEFREKGGSGKPVTEQTFVITTHLAVFQDSDSAFPSSKVVAVCLDSGFEPNERDWDTLTQFFDPLHEWQVEWDRAVGAAVCSDPSCDGRATACDDSMRYWSCAGHYGEWNAVVDPDNRLYDRDVNVVNASRS